MKSIEQQLESMYHEHSTAVYHTALAFLKDPSAAQDVTHDVFLTYYEQLKEQARIRHLRAWLLTVTRNRCRNLLRAGQREFPEEHLPEISVEDSTQALQAQDSVERLLACLTEEEKLAFSLHYLEGYSYRELSLGFNVPIGTLQTRCHAARKKLKKALKQESSLRKEDRYDVSTIS